MDPITSIEFALGTGSFLFDVFDKAVQAYELYSTTKSLSNISAHLVAKLLLIEGCQAQAMGVRACVYQISKSDGLIRRGNEPGRFTPASEKQRDFVLYQAVLQALAGIEDTLTDITCLIAKYGLHVFEEDVTESWILLPIRRGGASDTSGTKARSETLTTSKERGRDVQALASLRKKFRWAIKDKSGFEALLERIRYYNDSLYCLLPKDSIETITRDTLAKLISSATSERLLQYTAAVEPTESRSSINSLPPAQYATIASAAQTSLQVANCDQSSYDTIWIDEQSITYDGEDSCIGTLSEEGAVPARVFVEKLRYMYCGSYSEDELTRKASL